MKTEPCHVHDVLWLVYIYQLDKTEIPGSKYTELIQVYFSYLSKVSPLSQ